MSAARKPEKGVFDSHRLEMIRLGREVNAAAGIPTGEPEVTAEELQESMRASGIRPEDRIFTRELMRMRYGDDWEDDWEHE